MCIYKPTSGPGSYSPTSCTSGRDYELLSTRHQVNCELGTGNCESGTANAGPTLLLMAIASSSSACTLSLSSSSLSLSLSLGALLVNPTQAKQPKTIPNNQTTRCCCCFFCCSSCSCTQPNRTETELNWRRRRFWEVGNNARQIQQAEMPEQGVLNR